MKWDELIAELEEFRRSTGWSLAETWGHVHRGDYEAARRSFDEAKAHLHETRGAVSPGT